MALHINCEGIQKEIDLNLNVEIRQWGESPSHCFSLYP